MFASVPLWITRKFVVKAAQNVGMAIEESCLTPKRAAGADELFLAVTTKDIIPVVKFDGTTIGDGTPGPLTKALTAEFLKFTL